jgi:hypothetical protein
MTDTTREALAAEAKRLAEEYADHKANGALRWKTLHALFATIDRLATPEQAPAVQERALGKLLTKLPSLDPSWSAEVQERWWRCFNTLRALATTPAVQAEQPAEPWTLTRSIIYDCPALKVPQAWVQKLGATAQIVALKGADDAMAQRILAALNAASRAQAEDALTDEQIIELWKAECEIPGHGSICRFARAILAVRASDARKGEAS